MELFPKGLILPNDFLQKFGPTVQVILQESGFNEYLKECHRLICDEIVALPRERYDDLSELQSRARVIMDLQSMVAEILNQTK